MVKSPVRLDNRARTSDIDEEIYTETFEEEGKISDDKDPIEEDIVEASKGLSSSSLRDSRRPPSVAEDSILEEARRSPDRDSILEESGLNRQSSSALKQAESIPEEQDFSSARSVQNQFELRAREDEARRKKLVHEMLEEMRRYEQASVSTVVVERMEKIIVSSLAQKDKLLLAQRLNELEQQKQH